MNKFREQFPILEKYTYLNTASSGVISKNLLKYRHQLDTEFMNGGSVFRDAVYEDMDSVKNTLGDVFNCPQELISLIPSFSYGLNAVLNSLATTHKVLLLNDDYPSLMWPFTRRGFDCVHIDPTDFKLEYLIEQIRLHRPTIFAFSIVQWQTGMVIPPTYIKEIRATFPELIIICDGTQFLGTTEFDFLNSGIDIFAASCYKWLCAGYGNALLFFSARMDDLLCPTIIGYNTFRRPHQKKLDHVSTYFEPGHQDYLAFESLKFSVNYFNQIGLNNIQLKIGELMQYAFQKISDLGIIINTKLNPVHYSGIISFEVDRKLIQQLAEKKIICSYRNGVRMSMHAYNTKEDIDRLCACLVE